MDNELYHLLFIDDDKDFLHSMNMATSSKLFSKSDGVEIELHFVSDPNEGLTFMKELTNENEKIAIIISDQQMPKLTGIEFIEQANKIVPNAFKMLLTGYASLDSAKYAINHQILDQYVSKPIEDYDNFVSLIKNALKIFHFREEKEQAERKIKEYVHELEYRNAKIRRMHLTAEKLAYLAQGFRKLDLDEVYDLIINKIPSVFNAKYSSLFLYNEEDNSLHMVRSNYLNETFTKVLTADDQSPMMVALRRKETIVIQKIEETSYDFLNKECLGSSCIIIPFSFGSEHKSSDILHDSEGIKGVLNMGNIIDMEAEEVVKYSASLIRNLLGINILNARLYQKTQKLATFDSLTGLYNRHIFIEFLKKECDYSERKDVPFFLAMLDIDDFKVINDTYGHRIGDEVLTQLGQLFQNAARKSDIVSRFGGEEFCWIIHGEDMKNVLAVLDRFRTEIFNSEFPNKIRVSVSTGLTSYYPHSDDTLEKLIDRADEALYQAKGNGKNRVEVSLRNEDHEQSKK